MPIYNNEDPLKARWHIWERAGISMSEYRDLPWPQKKMLILKYGELPEQLKERTTIERMKTPVDIRHIIFGEKK
jgi:hypothetical protein